MSAVDPQLSSLARRAAELLIARGEHIAVCESSAGGLISASLLSVPGASAYYRGGVVVYTVVAARALLKGPVLAEGSRGASEVFGRHLAASAAATLDAPWGLGETGATGPTPNRYGDANGHAWLAVHGPGGIAKALNVETGSDDREANMVAFAAAALELLVGALSEAK